MWDGQSLWDKKSESKHCNIPTDNFQTISLYRKLQQHKAKPVEDNHIGSIIFTAIGIKKKILKHFVSWILSSMLCKAIATSLNFMIIALFY